jgi:hypothetical protein
MLAGAGSFRYASHEHWSLAQERIVMLIFVVFLCGFVMGVGLSITVSQAQNRKSRSSHIAVPVLGYLVGACVFPILLSLAFEGVSSGKRLDEALAMAAYSFIVCCLAFIATSAILSYYRGCAEKPFRK